MTVFDTTLTAREEEALELEMDLEGADSLEEMLEMLLDKADAERHEAHRVGARNSAKIKGAR